MATVAKNKTVASKVKAFDTAIEMLQKKYGSVGEAALTKLGDQALSVEMIPTGSLTLDSLTGGGFPKGRIIEIYGPESSGKTTFALTAIGNVQKAGGKALFIDAESALDPKYAAVLGVDISELWVAQDNCTETALQMTIDAAETAAFDIIVIDSVAALTPRAELEGEIGDSGGGMAVVARTMSAALRKLATIASRTKTTVIFINQLRSKVGIVFGSPEETTGGKALKYYASLRIDVRRKDQIKDGEQVLGVKTQLKVVKNKVAPPFREGITAIQFSKGISVPLELLEGGPHYGVIERPNNRTYLEGADPNNVIGTSAALALKRLETDTALRERLEKAMYVAIRADAVVPPSSVTDAADDDEDPDSDIDSEH